MDEVFPVCLGFAMGALIWRAALGRRSSAIGAAAMFAIGLAATVLSGEYLVSWTYLALDLGEAALGLIAGFVVARRFWPKAAVPASRGLR